MKRWVATTRKVEALKTARSTTASLGLREQVGGKLDAGKPQAVPLRTCPLNTRGFEYSDDLPLWRDPAPLEPEDFLNCDHLAFHSCDF